jgi:PRTRC genetic system protein A
MIDQPVVASPLIEYFAAIALPLVAPKASGIEYWIAANGVFARAQRPGLTVLIPVSIHEQPIKGLAVLQPFIQLNPLVPEELLWQMWALARRACPAEVLFHLVLENGQWQLITPEQLQSQTHCQPLHMDAGSSTHQALIEMHSHGDLPAYFSAIDDADECSGFRIYGVLGKVRAQPFELLLRVGVFGHAWTISVSQVFEVDDNHRLNDLCQPNGSKHYAMQQ